MGDIDFNNFRIGFIGFGLIGGSLAKVLREFYPNIYIMGYEHGETISEDNELGLADGVLNNVSDSLYDFSLCNIIFLCAPVKQNTDYLPVLKDIIRDDCIITDVGSVKTNIHQCVESYDLEKNFIGGHPMTGSEKSGYRYSNPKLFENAYYVLTPTNKSSNNQIDILSSLVENIGAIPIILDYVEHDKIVAAISHLPHIVASSLVNLVKNQKDNSDLMKQLAAGGFRDITRIASSSPEIWENISISNSIFISVLLKQYISILQDIIVSLDNKNSSYIYDTFASAKEFRNELPDKGKGILEKIHEIYLDIEDEAGAIATVASLLANNNISIKNIGIIHNREFQDGVLRIEFYDEVALTNAVELLKHCNYLVYER